MSTQRTFQAMLNEYLTNDLLKEEIIKRDYILTTVTKDDKWKGGKLPVPFKGAGASSVKFGGLTAASDIGQSKYVRGSIDDYVEVWGSLIFNHRDLQEHDGKIPETTFLRILPDEIDMFMTSMKEKVSIQLGSGPHFAKVMDETNSATGIFGVDKIDRFEIDQHIVIDDDNSVLTDVYVIAINVNTTAVQDGNGIRGFVTFSLTRGGSAANLSAYTISQNAKFYYDGVTDGSGNFTTFVSIRSALLSAANGGSTLIHGVNKLLYPILQAVNIDGSDITSTNLLDKLFDSYRKVREKAKGNASVYVMSYKHLGSVMKALEAQKGPFVVTQNPKRSLYGWTEMSIASVKTGEELKVVGIQEMDDDIIPLMDWSTVVFHSNGFFKKRMSPEGKEYFEIRNTTGYQYVVDVSLFGEMEFKKPGQCGIIYGVNYAS